MIQHQNFSVVPLTSNHQDMEGNECTLLTPQELAAKLKVKISWVYGESRKRGPGAIPRVKVGKYLRFRLNEVLQWLADLESGNWGVAQ